MTTQVIKHQSSGLSIDDETLCLLGGAALILLGAGLILSNSEVRKYLKQIDVRGLAQNLSPEIDRFLKMRSM